ncbi:hypothetical protein ONS96_003338 [Cadophora gregata f. sp. sojae]|nr:hypothetical protein ONS96_003338 [Cadophora gregata f. sp. sojae]
MNRTTSPDDEASELMQKRRRNRLAQQKYRKKLKSHIEDLEKRAAEADRTAKGSNTQARTIVAGDMSSFPTFSTQLGERSGFATLSTSDNISISPSQACESVGMDIQAPSSSSGPAASFLSHQRKPAQHHQVNFSIFDDTPWASHKNLSLQDIESLDRSPELHADTTETTDPVGLTSNSHGLLDCSSSSFQLPTTNEFNPSNELKSSRFLSTPPQQPRTAPEPTSLEARVEYVLRCSKTAGFDDLDSFVSCYYTGLFKNNSSAKLAQTASRTKGLPAFLEELHTQVNSWSSWEASGYQDTIVRSAADLITAEFDRLARRKYSCELELWQNIAQTTTIDTAAAVDGGDSSSSSSGSVAALHQLRSMAAELQKTLRYELPNLYTLTAKLSPQDVPTRVTLLLATIRIMTAPGSRPLHEAANWVYVRAKPPNASRDGSVDDLESSPMGSI